MKTPKIIIFCEAIIGFSIYFKIVPQKTIGIIIPLFTIHFNFGKNNKGIRFINLFSF